MNSDCVFIGGGGAASGERRDVTIRVDAARFVVFVGCASFAAPPRLAQTTRTTTIPFYEHARGGARGPQQHGVDICASFFTRIGGLVFLVSYVRTIESLLGSH